MKVVVPSFARRFPGVIAAMSTREGGVSPEPYGLNTGYSTGDDEKNVTENRRRFFSAAGITAEMLASPHQVHSAAALRAEQAGRYEACDALITNRTGLALGISVADCVPILLYDPKAPCIAAVHAGWRGTAGRIVANAVKLLADTFGSRPAEMVAWIGPSAGACCYEVGEEVAARFAPPIVLRTHGEKPHLDLRRANRELLLEAGVPDGSMQVEDACTICNAALFHSYRRDGKRSGRMMAVISMVEG